MTGFFDTTSNPAGHGFIRSGVESWFACYSFELRSGLLVEAIVQDDTQSRTGRDEYGRDSPDSRRPGRLGHDRDSDRTEADSW